MILDRLETLSAISFVEPAIPKKAESGRNCLFIRVDQDKLVLTGGSEFVVKKAILIRPNTTVESADTKKKPLPKTFMIPRADLLAFKEMMKEHKADCKKMAKNDPSYLFVEMDDEELISYDGKIVYQQPKFEFKDLETVFQINKDSVSEIPVMGPDISAAVSGFQNSKKIDITFTGPGGLVHFEQGEYESILIPPVEKPEDDDNEQKTIDGD